MINEIIPDVFSIGITKRIFNKTIIPNRIDRESCPYNEEIIKNLDFFVF